MTHHASSSFWYHYRRLPDEVQRPADKNFRLLENNPYHPSLHFKKIHAALWSARVGRGYRAIATPDDGDFLWLWIGPHAAYDRLLKR
ncbi:MAG: hypothetical protein AAGI91_08795 [Bacteroidota bacterium]